MCRRLTNINRRLPVTHTTSAYFETFEISNLAGQLAGPARERAAILVYPQLKAPLHRCVFDSLGRI